MGADAGKQASFSAELTANDNNGGLMLDNDFDVTDYRAEQMEIYEEQREAIEGNDELSEPEKERQLNALALQYSQLTEQWHKEDEANGDRNQKITRDFVADD